MEVFSVGRHIGDSVDWFGRFWFFCLFVLGARLKSWWHIYDYRRRHRGRRRRHCCCRHGRRLMSLSLSLSLIFLLRFSLAAATRSTGSVTLIIPAGMNHHHHHGRRHLRHLGPFDDDTRIKDSKRAGRRFDDYSKSIRTHATLATTVGTALSTVRWRAIRWNVFISYLKPSVQIPQISIRP